MNERSPDLQPVILRTLVGSHAHGLARPDSDRDYREVFVIPTSTMLRLSDQALKFAWMSQNKHTDDEGGDEIAKWLHLVLKGAPNSIELAFAPLAEEWEPETDIDPAEVQRMGRLLLTRKAVETGVIGYGLNGFRKITDNPSKWKASTLRVLLQGRLLVRTGSTTLVVDEMPEDDADLIRRGAANKLSEGQVLDIANGIIADIKSGSSALPDSPDLDHVNRWLLELRRDRW